MAEKPLPQTANVVSEKSTVGLSVKNLIGILGSVAVGVWFAFGVIERLNNIETNYKLIATDIEKNIEFRIKYPRGDLGVSAGEAELFMLVEHMSGIVEKHTQQLEGGMHNKVNIEFLSKQVDNLLEDVEKLKDKVRQNGSN